MAVVTLLISLNVCIDICGLIGIYRWSLCVFGDIMTFLQAVWWGCLLFFSKKDLTINWIALKFDAHVPISLRMMSSCFLLQQLFSALVYDYISAELIAFSLASPVLCFESFDMPPHLGTLSINSTLAKINMLNIWCYCDSKEKVYSITRNLNH